MEKNVFQHFYSVTESADRFPIENNSFQIKSKLSKINAFTEK